MNCAERYDYGDRDRIVRLLKSTVLDSMIIPISSDSPNDGYVRAMRGLISHDSKEIFEGCKEEHLQQGQYYQQSCILSAYITTSVISIPSIVEKETPIALKRLNEIICSKLTTPGIKQSARLCRANIYIKLSEFELADDDLNQLETVNFDIALLYVIKSGLLNEMPLTHPKLHESLYRCSLLMPRFYDAQLQMAIVESGHDDIQLIEHLKVLLETFPDELTTYYRLSQKYIARNQMKEAEEILSDAERNFSRRSNELWCMRGSVDPMHPFSVEYFRQALKWNAGDEYAYQQLFHYYSLKSLEYAKALEVANRALTYSTRKEHIQLMFNYRQNLLSKIIEQDFWDKL